MPVLHLLPLGTIVDGEDPAPGWENLRFMITGYYPRVVGSDRYLDYVVTPWPLGYINIDDGSRKMFYSCNEDAIKTVDFIGAVDESLKEKTDWYYEDSLHREEFNSPLATGAKPMALSYGDLPTTIGNVPFRETEALPLGSVVSVKDSDKKLMIYQHSGSCEGKRYDYGVCSWPEGENPGSLYTSVIKHSDITAVHFRGYENALSQELARRLEKKRKGSLFSRILGR